MFEKFLKEIKDATAPILEEFGIKEEMPPFEIPLEDFGDASLPTFSFAPILKKAPPEIAKEFASRYSFPEDSLVQSEVETSGAYVNYRSNYTNLANLLLKEIKEKGDSYGSGGLEGKFTVEHTSANPDGPLHIGHGRNSIIGDSLAKVMDFAGYDVETQYYLNDMGKQLAVVVWGLRNMGLKKDLKNDEAVGEVYVEANRRMEESEEVQKAISALMQAYEAGDEGVVEEFRKAAEYCLEGQNGSLGRLNIKHDGIIWESQFVRDSTVEKTVEKLKSTPYAKTDDVLYLDLTSFGIEKELVLQRSDGTYLYATRDIAHHIWRSRKGKVIDVWGSDHKLLADQMTAVLKILGEEEPEFVIYEFITLPEGSMSTRKGRFISLDELVDESVKRAYDEVENRRPEEPEEFKQEVAEKVGTAAVRYNIIRVSPEKSMVFRWDEALDFERQGSPFIQYAYARACRILEKEAAPSSFQVPELTKEEKDLLNILSKFSWTVQNSATSRKPSIIAHYCLDLATSFHRFYMYQPVIKSKEKDFRLNLVLATKVVLKNALQLLGIEALERM